MTIATEEFIFNMARKSPDELHTEMLKAELRMGYELVSEAPWLDWNDWRHETIISTFGNRVRLALLHAKQPWNGALTRLIARIKEAKLLPIIVEPNSVLVDWCLRHEYRSRKVAIGTPDAHVVWYPRLCLNFTERD